MNVFDSARQSTPLFCAAVHDASPVVDVLLCQGKADINLGLHELGLSALHCAVRADAVDNVALLLQVIHLPTCSQDQAL